MKDQVFRDRVYTIMEEEVIMKFANREGDAAAFYEIPEE